MINLLYFLPFKRIYPISCYTLQLVMLNQFCRRILFSVQEFNILSFTPLSYTYMFMGLNNMWTMLCNLINNKIKLMEIFFEQTKIIFLFNVLYRIIVFKLIMSVDDCVLKFKLKPFFQEASGSITIYACHSLFKKKSISFFEHIPIYNFNLIFWRKIICF